MPSYNKEYKKIISELEKTIKDPNELATVKEKFMEMSMIFIDMLDRVSEISYGKLNDIEESQEMVCMKMDALETILCELADEDCDCGDDCDCSGDEHDDCDCCGGFEIICPYCNYEFEIDSINPEEDINCPKCLNTIELDYDIDGEDEEISGGCCGGGCCGCNSGCGTGHNDEEDEI